MTIKSPRSWGATAEEIAAGIRSGDWPSDLQFDAFLPAEVRAASNKYWTQLRVARRVAAWLAELEVRSVVDIGSGSSSGLAVGQLVVNADGLVGVLVRVSSSVSTPVIVVAPKTMPAE